MTTNSALQERICDIVANTFGLSPMDVDADASTLTLPAWTSLAHLRLMANVQQEFGLRLSMDEMMAMTSVEGIEQALIANGVEA